jgi:hypothetical protein
MREFLHRYWKPALIASASVALIAVVILVSSLFSKPETPVTPDTTTTSTAGPSTTRNDTLIDQAEKALASGDTTSAASLARQVLKSDPGNARALVVLEAVNSTTNGSSTSTTTAGNGTSASSDTGFLEALADFPALLPRSFSGYGMSFVATDAANADVSGSPVREGGPAFRIAWAVRDRASVKAAADYITKTSKVLYPKSATTVDIDGIAAYFGTDGTQLATVAYRRGRYVFEVVVVADKKGNPETLRSLAIDAARAFADKPV